MKTPAIFRKLGFETLLPIEGRASVADLFKPNSRSGVYVLHFANGEFYVGQAGDVVRRHGQHRKTYSDITGMSFQRAPSKHLLTLESEAISRMELSGLKLRNITLTSLPPLDSDFDQLMSHSDQARWLSDLSFNFHGDSRPVDVDQRMKYKAKYELLRRKPLFGDLCRFLRLYAQLSLPALWDAEMSFWALSCLPQHKIYCRVNLNWQEVLVVHWLEPDQLGFSFFVGRSILAQGFGKSLAKLTAKHPAVHVYDGMIHEAVGGANQTNLQLLGIEPAIVLLQDPVVMSSIREFNLRLMRWRPTSYSRYHCPQLADCIV